MKPSTSPPSCSDRCRQLAAGVAAARAVAARHRKRPLHAVAGGERRDQAGYPHRRGLQLQQAVRRAGPATPCPDERAAMDAEIGRLQAENDRLKAQLAARDQAGRGKTDEALPKSDSLKKAGARKWPRASRKIEIPLPSDQDMDRMMSFVERAWRRLIDMANRVQKDVSRARSDARGFQTSRHPLRAPGRLEERSVVTVRTSLSRARALTLSALRDRDVAADRADARHGLRRSHRRGREIPRRSRRTGRRGDAVHPPYLGVADDPGERRSLRARLISRRRSSRLAPENAGWTHDTEGSGRHARACQDHADVDVAADPGAERRARARHMAGDLPDRASPPARTGARSCCSSSARHGHSCRKTKPAADAPRPVVGWYARRRPRSKSQVW